MKRKEIMKLLTGIGLSICMTGCSAAGTALPLISKAEPEEEVSDEDLLMEAMAQVVPSHSSSSGKSETVYVLMNADGTSSQVIVSDQLKNKDGEQSLKDSTELKNIRNVNGYGSYVTNEDGTITWDAQGSDIFYQGTTDKELPLDVSISYELDGVAVSAEELAGKSGHVAISLNYENNTKETVDVDGEEYEVCVPFAVMSGMILSNDHFTNVEAENGRVINEGNNQIVVGLAYPGLKESLDWDDVIERSENEEAKEALEEVKFPESVRIEADVTDFELGMTVTLAGCDLLQQADAADGIDLSEVQSKMEELSDGATKLVDGTKELKNGTAELYDGTGKLYDGSSELKDGVSALKDGSVTLYNGIGELKNGTDSLYSGSESLKSGTDSLYSGTESLKNGTSDLYNGTSQLKDGSEKLSNGAASLYDGVVSYTEGAKSVSDGAEKLSAGAAGAKAGADQLKDAFEKNDISGNAAKLTEGAAALSAGITQLNTELTTALTESSSQMQQAESLLNGVCDWMGQTLAGIEAYGAVQAEMLVIPEALAPYGDALKGICGYSAQDCLDALSAYNTAHYILVSAPDKADAKDLADKYSRCNEIAGICRGEATVYAAMIESMGSLATNASTGIASLQQGADQLSGGMSAFSAGVTAIGEGVNKLDGGLLELSQGAAALSEGAKTLTDNNAALVKGASDLKDGAGSLNNGVAKVNDGAYKLNGGAAELLNGAGKLKDGAYALNDGVGSLKDGALRLYDGAGSLNDGVGSLYDGAVKLNDGAGSLKDGALRLDEGMAELRDGMITLDEEGIQKISKLLGDNAAEVLNRFKAVKKAGEEYKSFTGALEDDQDSVRFIYKTGAVSAK